MTPTIPPIWFSQRERQVLELLCESKATKQIAAELEISIHAVRWHISAMLKKLDLFDRTELIVWALQHPDDVRAGYTREHRLHKSGCTCDAGYCTSMLRIHPKAA